MFLIKQNDQLTTEKLGKIIQQYQTRDLPKLQRYYNYYKGRQNILTKVASDVGKPCNQVVVNYCKGIVDNYTGYLTGKDISYSGEGIEEILDVLNYNDVHAEDTSMLRDALIYGKAVELNYIDMDGKQRFKKLDPRECIDVYDDTLDQNLMYAIRFYRADFIGDSTESYIVEVYDAKGVRKYKSTMGFSSFALLDETPHYFNQVPLTFFYLNEEQDSIFDSVMSLQDAYNSLLSGEVDSWDAFADAYLVLKGCQADEEDLISMKKNRVLMLDSDANADYLTKSVSDTQIENILQNINDQIHKIALSPDFNDEKFMASSGIAMRYKLIGMENNASSIESNMRKALQKRVELIVEILNLKGAESIWRDIVITFTRNLPTNVEDTASMVNNLRGLVSDETLLAQLPFIDNAEEEYKKVQDQKQANMSLYSFGDEDEAT